MGMSSSDVVVGSNATATQYNNLRKDVRNSIKDLQTDSDGVTVTFNLANGAVHTVILGGSRTFAVSNPTAGQSFVLIIGQDGTGSRLVTWWGGIKWTGAAPPVLTATINRYDIVSFFYDGTNYFGTLVGLNYG